MKTTDQQQYDVLQNILKEVLQEIQVQEGTEVELNLKTNSDTDTEIFIRKGFSIYSFRCYGNSLLTFYERYNHLPNTIFSVSGLKEQLILLLR